LILIPTVQPSTLTRQQLGFTLVELAIVLVIIAFLTSGLLMGITAHRVSAENTDAHRQLDNIREALTGFAMSNGRLPCPANPALTSADLSVGTEDRPDTSSPCNRTFGVIPWVTLGLQEVDPWGRRYSYFASSSFSGQVPTPTGALVSFTLDTLGNANIKDSAASSANIASNVPTVVVSHGSNGFGAWQPNGTQIAGASGDELENANSTLTFVSRTPGNDFDDLVTWIAPSILMAKMVAAGRLP
jgi:prepilin-type N-terminal cleavage/methylation domain-containing protein